MRSLLWLLTLATSGAWVPSSSFQQRAGSAEFIKDNVLQAVNKRYRTPNANSALTALFSSTKETTEVVDYDVPDDPVISIKPTAMKRLRELRDKGQVDENGNLILRMGVRNGGCSGLSYVMDFSKEEEVQDDDAIDEYPSEKIKCVVDAKSMLYLYGLELDYSEELIGGGFKFYNPNAEESCGCGSSFGI